MTVPISDADSPEHIHEEADTTCLIEVGDE